MSETGLCVVSNLSLRRNKWTSWVAFKNRDIIGVAKIENCIYWCGWQMVELTT